MNDRKSIVTTDNNLGNCILDSETCQAISPIANCKLNQLTDKEKCDLWIFPQKENRFDDKIDDEVLFSLSGARLTTGNIMGFISSNGVDITIRSRFSAKNGNDWFMQYMLQKVFAINIFNLNHSSSNENILDITALMFPHFLQKAVNQGIYREYTRCSHNDSHPRGAIDFNAHIRQNYPFKNGKIAYMTREFLFDNSVTQLIRHTIEYLRSNTELFSIIYSTKETRDNINQIIEATPSYRRGDLTKILLANLRPKIHPYYSEYAPLQKLCLQILNHQKLGYSTEGEKIQGVLFDGAWLWEEYLNLTLSQAGFKHPNNRLHKDAIFPFVGSSRYKRYPDFMKENVIADAKYKRIVAPAKDTGKMNHNIQREDLNQMIAYLYITDSDTGIFICPNEFSVIDPQNGTFLKEENFVIKTEEFYLYKIGKLSGKGGLIQIMGLNIPRDAGSFDEFREKMKLTESLLLKKIETQFA